MNEYNFINYNLKYNGMILKSSDTIGIVGGGAFYSLLKLIAEHYTGYNYTEHEFENFRLQLLQIKNEKTFNISEDYVAKYFQNKRQLITTRQVLYKDTNQNIYQISIHQFLDYTIKIDCNCSNLNIFCKHKEALIMLLNNIDTFQNNIYTLDCCEIGHVKRILYASNIQDKLQNHISIKKKYETVLIKYQNSQNDILKEI